jgi:hypothetical protein
VTKGVAAHFALFRASWAHGGIAAWSAGRPTQWPAERACGLLAPWRNGERSARRFPAKASRPDAILKDEMPQRRSGRAPLAIRVAIASVIVLIGRPALAQQDPGHRTDRKAAAQVLFDDARALMDRGEHAQACPKLEVAASLYEGSGVLLNLGNCYERLGRTASAFRTFGKAGAIAARLERPEDEAETRRRQAALEPRVARIVLRVAHDVPGLVVKDNGAIVDRGAWGGPLAVDPGTHTLSPLRMRRSPRGDRGYALVDRTKWARRGAHRRASGLLERELLGEATPTTADCHGVGGVWRDRRAFPRCRRDDSFRRAHSPG